VGNKKEEITSQKDIYLYYMKANKTLSAEFFFGATPLIFERASILRKNMTQSEKIVWSKINERKINGWYFRRQHPISQFIADFYCHHVRLVIEVDGRIHNKEEQIQRDKGRDYMMNNLGLTVLRFTNDEVARDIEGVIKKIGEHKFSSL
jgi:very-short-patch-repair endonuclease